YTTQVNFPAIETALQGREKMHIRRRRLGALQAEQSIDVKLDHGGIRDIEFLVQCVQRVYGGAEPWLRSGGTLFSLQKLHDKRHISGKEFHELTSAYVFLRHLEHRLQLRQGQQTHRLPGNPVELDILRRSMVRLLMGEDRSADILEAVRRRMAAVTEIYNRIIYHQQARKDQEAADREFQLRSRVELSGTDQSNQQILERLASDVPRLHEVAGRSDLGPQTRRNLYRFLSSAFTSSERYAAVVRH